MRSTTPLSATFASLGQPSHFVHPAEAVHGDLGRIRSNDVVLLLSYSGETEELLNFAAILKADGVAGIAISKHAQTNLAKMSTVHISLGDIEEACPLNLAPTATTATMLAAGDALALAVARRRNFKADDFHKIHPGGMLGIGLRPVIEALRFQVGKNLTCVALTATMKSALQSSGDGRRSGALMVVDSRCAPLDQSVWRGRVGKTNRRLHDQTSALLAGAIIGARRGANDSRIARG